MYQARQAFDVAAPFIVASQELVCGARRFVRGESFPWRDLGVSELDLLTLWSALKVDVSPPSAAPAALPAATAQAAEAAAVEMGAVIAPGGEKRTLVIEGQPVEFTAGPTINVATPEQQRQRNKRR